MAVDDGPRTVEPVLDVVLETLCGPAERDPAAEVDGDRWMSPSTVVEYGDRAAERYLSALRYQDGATAADHMERTTRMAVSFAATFWHEFDGRPTAVDRVLAECLVDNLRAAADPELDDLSDEHFAIALNAKFVGTLRETPTSAVQPSLFRPEIRKLCERFLAVDHLTDLIAASDGNEDDGMFGRSHVEHLERHVLAQRLVDYVTGHYSYRVGYCAVTDTLVFRFMAGERGNLVENYREHRWPVDPKIVE